VTAVYTCANELRRIAVRDSLVLDSGQWLNGIDHVEVYEPSDADEPHAPRHRVLVIRLLKDLDAPELTPEWFRITGGVRIPEVSVTAVARVRDLAGPVAGFTDAARAIFLRLAEAPAVPVTDGSTHRLDERDRVVVALCAQAGDFSRYTLALTPPASGSSQTWDPRLTSLSLQFRIDCPNDFDCAPTPCPPGELPVAPRLDYLARDYASFRRLMLDRLSETLPGWTERSPADLGVTLVELLAYAADHLAYYQDAVATEAYLNTARRRPSLRRHARLLDYEVSEGINARAWVCLTVEGADLPGSDAQPVVQRGDPVLTRVSAADTVLRSERFDSLVALQKPTVFEAMHDLVSITRARSRMRFYTWGDAACCLPRGATAATLLGRAGDLALEPGDVLVLAEVRDPQSGAEADANPAQRHAVRLVEVGEEQVDPLTGQQVLDVRWHQDDALPFPLFLHDVVDPDTRLAEPVSLAFGNVVLVDHGYTVRPSPRSPELQPVRVPEQGRYRPRLERKGLTFAAPYDPLRARAGSASAALVTDQRRAVPVVRLGADGLPWLPVRDLLSSGPSAREFVVEMDDRAGTTLRFGDGINGRRPTPGTVFAHSYRVGSGAAGNVGAESLVHLVSDFLGDLVESTGATLTLTNLLPARGGVDAEPARRIREDAPYAFRKQERAVTAEDYAEVLARHPRVQQAVATFRWTGSWNTVFAAVDPYGTEALDEALREELYAWLERYRMAGRDIRIDAARYVPLDVALRICVDAGQLRSTVRERLLEHFSSGLRRDGSQGLFHPDRLSFGQTVYVSQLIADAMAVPGVHAVQPLVVRRFDREAAAVDGVLRLDRLEIPRLDNDPNRRENGLLQLEMEGGL
jgi:hypothetical protein